MPVVLESAPAANKSAQDDTSPARAAHVNADVAYLSHEFGRAPAARRRFTILLCFRPAAHTNELK